MALDANGKRLLATSSSVRAPIYQVRYLPPFLSSRIQEPVNAHDATVKVTVKDLRVQS